MTTPIRHLALDPDADLLSLFPQPPSVVWLRDGEGFVGWGEAWRADVGAGEERFAAASAAARRWLAACAGDAPPPVFASFTFDPRCHGSVVVVPQLVATRRGGRAHLTVVGDAPVPAFEPPPLPAVDRVRYAGSSKPDVQWLDAVAEAVKRIANGDVHKVVLARDYAVWSRTPFDAGHLCRRLAGRFTDCFTFLCDGLVGATPELLVRRRGGRVESLVLAGSAARGAGAEEDARFGEALLASDKDQREHAFAVASVLERLTAVGVQATAARVPSLLRLANVQHLATAVTGTTAPTRTALDLVAALHPTAAVGGTPTAAAVALIRELEGMDRGRYSGPVGWIDATGDGEFGIALRCAKLLGARARLFAGAGIVEGSLPEAELEETRLKLKAMQSVLEG